MKRILLLSLLLMTGCNKELYVSNANSSLQSESDKVNSTVVTQSISLFVDGKRLPIFWEDNESVKALSELLKVDNIQIEMERYGGFEQVGQLPQTLPSDDVQMTTQPGDIVLYSGDRLVLFFGSNSWAYTKLGKVENFSEEIKNLLDKEQVTVNLTID